jgi:phosphoribosylformimino-5-aminoimidazole carboxamide ribotide isomerase
MLVIPAIDLKAGACVRLRQGDMQQSTTFSTDPLITAQRWVDEGAKRLHIVDLDGAFSGSPQNYSAIEQICKKHNDIPIQVGGGIRDIETCQKYFDIGVSYCIIGTVAQKEPVILEDMCQKYPYKIILGIDAKNGKVATEGWADVSQTNAVAMAKSFDYLALSAIVYTDISRDGMMEGLNTTETVALAKEIDTPIIASGGMTNMNDVKKIQQAEKDGVFAVIIGRALYEGTITLAKVKELCP